MKQNNKNRSLLMITLVLVLLLGAAYVLYSKLAANMERDALGPGQNQGTQSGGASASGQQPEPQKAPDFLVTDIDGNEAHLSDFVGKPVVLNFWASWCGPCRSEMGDFDEAYQELGEDVQFLMVNATDGQRETVKVASEFVSQAGYTFPVYYDTEFDASITYGVRSLPTTYFIDAEGYLVAAAHQAIDKETLQKGIDMILPK